MVCSNFKKTLLLLSTLFITCSESLANDKTNKEESGLQFSKVTDREVIELNEGDFFNQVYEDEKIFQKLDKGGVISQHDGEFNYIRLKKSQLKGKRPIHRAVLCVDENFSPIDLILVYSFKKVKGEYGESLYTLTGSSHLYEDGFDISKVKCAAFVDMVYSKVFKFPMVFGKVKLNTNENSIEKFVLKNQKEESMDLVKFKFSSKEYTIRSFVGSAIIDGGYGNYDYQNAHISLIEKNMKEKKIFSYKQVYFVPKERSIYSSTKLKTIGDFNDDGRVDILLEERFDGKNTVHVLYIQNDNGFEVAGRIFVGGC